MNATSPTTTQDIDALAARAARSVELAPTRAVTRLASIDVLRGIVIVIMALDHVRAYFTDVRFDPLDPAQSNLLLYFTRWITNYCAPVFVFLAGTSAYLIRKRNTAAQTAQFLATRGLWLIVLEMTLITMSWTFNLDYTNGPILQVIWAIGVSMLFLAAMVRLRWYEVGAIGIAICVLHNLFESVPMPQSDGWSMVWSLLYVKGPTPIAFVYYPLIPWIGVMAMGYALGVVFDLDAARRRRTLVWLGTGAIVAFLVLRLLNGYGDPDPWSVQGDAARTLMSFLDVEKYPPSLMYILVTLGPALLLLAAFENVRGPATRRFAVFGRVPLCFYVLHLPVIHLAAGLTALAAGYGTHVLTRSFMDFPATWGLGLGWVYAIWAMVVLALYPICKAFADIKRRRRDWWLSYL